MLYRNIIQGGMLWNSDEGSGGGEQGKAAPSADESKYNPATLDDAMKIIESLQKRVGEREAARDTYRERSNELETRLQALEDAQRKALEQTGNHQELAKRYLSELETLKPVAERAEALESVIRDSNNARLAQIPEDLRGLVPTDYAPEKLQRWLNDNQERITRLPAPRLDGGAGGSRDSGEVVRLTAEQKKIAARLGITDEQYAEQLKKI